MSRTETDSLGPIDVPDEAYWGAQTQRSLINFAIGQERMPLPVMHALALIKKAAARVNQRIGELPADLARLIEQAANEVLAGQHDEQFPLVVWQTGSGTQSNMNVNEVIAGRANELAGGTRLAPLYDVVPVFMDRSVTHQLAFRHGAAEFAEDFTKGNLRGLLADLGFAKPQLVRTIKQIASLATRIAEAATTLATKELANALHAQARVIEAALETDFGLPVRDFYDRISRDDRQERSGGWGGLS